MSSSHKGKSNDDAENDTGKKDFELTEAFVAPWGLANEERPFHFLWSGEIQRLDLYFTEPVELLEAYNIENDLSTYSSNESVENGPDQTKISLNKNDFVTQGYFSGKFNVPNIFDEAIVGQKVSASFELHNNAEKEWDDFTFTIRPEIQIGNAPDALEIPEDGEADPIEIEMQYIGFGMAEVNTKAGWKGELISKGDSIYHDMAQALVESGLYEKETNEIPDVPEDWKNDTGVEIPQNEIEMFVDDFREQIESGDLEEMFDPDVLDQLISFLESDDEQRDMSPVYQQIESMLLGSVLDLIDRHPSENVEMTNPQTKVEIESQMQGIVIRYELEDTFGNSYEEIEIPVDINDKRKDDDDELVEIEIDTDWEELQIDTDELHQLKEDIAKL